MTPFRQHREAIGWSIQHTADRLNVNERTVRRWDAREFECPPAIVDWLYKIYKFIHKTPPPAR